LPSQLRLSHGFSRVFVSFCVAGSMTRIKP
jgi:hypothetical protein